jgi:hypothetical protein
VQASVKSVWMRSRWLAFCPNTLIWIILIQQPQSSGSEARESRMRNRAREIWLTKHLVHALLGSFTCSKSMIWDRQLYFPSEGSVRYRFLSPITTHHPRLDWNPQQWVPWQAC